MRARKVFKANEIFGIDIILLKQLLVDKILFLANQIGIDEIDAEAFEIHDNRLMIREHGQLIRPAKYVWKLIQKRFGISRLEEVDDYTRKMLKQIGEVANGFKLLDKIYYTEDLELISSLYKQVGSCMSNCISIRHVWKAMESHQIGLLFVDDPENKTRLALVRDRKTERMYRFSKAYGYIAGKAVLNAITYYLTAPREISLNPERLFVYDLLISYVDTMYFGFTTGNVILYNRELTTFDTTLQAYIGNSTIASVIPITIHLIDVSLYDKHRNRKTIAIDTDALLANHELLELINKTVSNWSEADFELFARLA